MLPFDGGVELRARGRNKRHAVEVVLSETPAEAAVAYRQALDDVPDSPELLRSLCRLLPDGQHGDHFRSEPSSSTIHNAGSSLPRAGASNQSRAQLNSSRSVHWKPW